jgi:hypothetical protein
MVSVIKGPPGLELQLEIGAPVVDRDIQCLDLGTTHAFQLDLAQDVAVDDVTLDVTNVLGG